MTTRTGCKARQYADQMQCGRCGLAWDMNDPDSPACRDTGRKTIDGLLSTLAPQRVNPVRAHLYRVGQQIKVDDKWVLVTCRSWGRNGLPTYSYSANGLPERAIHAHRE